MKMNVYRVETSHPETPTMLLTYYTVQATSVVGAIEKAKSHIKKGDGPPEIIRAVVFLEQIDF
jgi:hypothetical protein